MKKSLVALFATTALMAGGSLPDVTYITEEAPQSSPFYGTISVGIDSERTYSGDYTYTDVSISLGAVVAREGQLGLAVEGVISSSFDTYGVYGYGLYVKPEIELNEGITTFAIIGYQKLYTYDMDVDALGLGIGGAFMVSDRIGIQASWIYSIVEEDIDFVQPEYSNTSIGLLYRF